MEPPPWMKAPETKTVLAALTARGAPARFVGGSVRDTLLRRPVTDIDIATPERPETVCTLLEAAGLRAIPTGIDHGTITGLAGGRTYEITTLRRDVETDGRRATVAFTDDWRQDAQRRDFTINALFADADGTIHDYFGGLVDLYAGRVRFVGAADQRIREDVLRILRFFRCHAHFGAGAPDADGLTACVQAAPLLEQLSGERVQTELVKLLAATDPLPVIDAMAKAGLFAHLLPDFWRQAPPGDALARLVTLERRLGRTDPVRRLSLLLTDGAAVRAATARLHLSNDTRDRLLAIATPVVEISVDTDAPAMRRALHEIGRDGVVDLILGQWARTAPGDADRVFAVLLAEAESWAVPRFPLAGRDVLALGLQPGPTVGRLLADVERWWIDGDFQATDTALRARLTSAVASAKPSPN